jgi:hypothetical protein
VRIADILSHGIKMVLPEDVLEVRDLLQII